MFTFGVEKVSFNTAALERCGPFLPCLNPLWRGGELCYPTGYDYNLFFFPDPNHSPIFTSYGFVELPRVSNTCVKTPGPSTLMKTRSHSGDTSIRYTGMLGKLLDPIFEHLQKFRFRFSYAVPSKCRKGNALTYLIILCSAHSRCHFLCLNSRNRQTTKVASPFDAHRKCTSHPNPTVQRYQSDQITFGKNYRNIPANGVLMRYDGLTPDVRVFSSRPALSYGKAYQKNSASLDDYA
ncbi:hypothetical protein Hypma_001330 [Hypsizygus marmoreus]|uniref:Uncharacterized protein n=1 Tax=Hypsizygus marmoreus TaxID=39966 RepID=A0A369K3V0_HYPMA|nr:hypothetical protein Hypma_001330 [Hypsizygus marmoreus]